MKLWIVGAQVKQIVDSTKPEQPLLDAIWELLGVFDSEELAVSHCHQRHHFVGAIEMNVRLPDERQEWPGVYYPLIRSPLQGVAA